MVDLVVVCVIVENVIKGEVMLLDELSEIDLSPIPVKFKWRAIV